MKYPQRLQVYTLKEIQTELLLDDSPHLGFKPVSLRHPDAEYPTMAVVQTSHCGLEKLIEDPAWANSKWKYMERTDEWIPVFRAEDGSLIESLCILEPDTDDCADRALFVYPRGMTCEQYVPYDPAIHGTVVRF